MIPRLITHKIRELAAKFPVITITGPRQSGKSTLLTNEFSSYDYTSLEDPDTRSFAMEDPRGFIAQFRNGAIIDEAQHVPKLFSYIQTVVDKEKKMGQFFLSGSQNFKLLSNINQSLAGRTSIFHLLPFALNELPLVKAEEGYEKYIFKGFYPAIYDRDINPVDYYANYIQTYVERDLRDVIAVKDLSSFQRFLKLCAGRIGQLLNFSSLATDCGITQPTAKAWFSTLEASYILMKIQPYYKNFSKRVIKSPKLYFHDVGLAAYLLGLRSADQVFNHYLKGGLFENMIVSELQKNLLNRGRKEELYFFRDSNGNEVDLILENAANLTLLEMKSGQTINQDFFRGVDYFKSLNKESPVAYLIYGGNVAQKRSNVTVLPWHKINEVSI